MNHRFYNSAPYNVLQWRIQEVIKCPGPFQQNPFHGVEGEAQTFVMELVFCWSDCTCQWMWARLEGVLEVSLSDSPPQPVWVSDKYVSIDWFSGSYVYSFEGGKGKVGEGGPNILMLLPVTPHSLPSLIWRLLAARVLHHLMRFAEFSPSVFFCSSRIKNTD